MRPSTIARLIEGAQAGSLVLTRSEAVELYAELTPNAAVVIAGNVVEIRSIPWHVLPEHPAELGELDPFRRNVHESFVEGLIDAGDQRGLFEHAAELEAANRRRAEEFARRTAMFPDELLHRFYDQDRDPDA